MGGSGDDRRNTMSTSKKHHYVPQAILRNFTVSGSATHYLSIHSKSKAPALRNIGRIFYRRHYNSATLEDGSKNDIVEKFFAYEFDNFIPEWTEAFKRTLETGQLRFSTSDSRKRFIQFFYNHMKRSPDFIEPIVSSVAPEVFNEQTVENYEKDYGPITEHERSLFRDPKWQEKVIGNSRVMNFGQQTDGILNRLVGLDICVATPASENKQFIIASNPVVRFENHVSQALGTEGVELWTTFTPRIAVGFVNSQLPIGLLTINNDEVRKFNTSAAKQSSAIASGSKPLLESLAKFLGSRLN